MSLSRLRIYGFAIFVFGLFLLQFAIRLHAEPLFTGCGGERPAPSNLPFELEVVQLINQVRAAESLPPLQHNADLSDAARYHALDMMHDDYFNHDSYDRVAGQLVLVCTWSERLASFFSIMAASENLAWGYTNPQAVVDGWMASPGHRQNILGSSWEMGVGVNNNVWVADFSRRPGHFPLIIDRDASATAQSAVLIYIYGAWSEMRLRTNNGEWGEWQPFQAEFAWQLAPTPGVQTVDAELRGGAARTLTSDQIELIDATIGTPTPPPTDPAPLTPTPTATLTPDSTQHRCPLNCPGAALLFLPLVQS